MRYSFVWMLCFFALTLVGGTRLDAQTSDTTPASDRLGITFINSVDHPDDQTRYHNAQLLGAGWNRWPLYWQRVQVAPNQFDWAAYDTLVQNDKVYGFRTNAILMGIPDFYKADGAVEGLNNPIFTDGTNLPGAGKIINPNNPWALFVHTVVQRYGGNLDMVEIWNEPDLPFFWTGSVQQYARLLKVGYLSARQAQPDIQVMFGGMAYHDPENNDYLARVLAIYERDPQAPDYNWFMDAVAVHNYIDAARSGLIVAQLRDLLSSYGLSQPIWLNESGVSVWDDYPGATWAADTPGERHLRVTMQQQAAFTVQSTTLAWANGAEVVFFHQLYDDCGNEPGGTDFAPDSGRSGDAYGLFRNERDGGCYTQSPLPGTPRPAASAFRLLAEVFGSGDFEARSQMILESQGVALTFERPTRRERVHVLWSLSTGRVRVDLPANSNDAMLYSIDNQDWFIRPEEGIYRIGLPPVRPENAAPSNMPGGIGGQPLILVENLGTLPTAAQEAPITFVMLDETGQPAALPSAEPSNEPSQPIQPTPGSLIGPGVVEPAAPVPTVPAPTLAPTDIPRPTVDPAVDEQPPIPSMQPLAVLSGARFIVAWSAFDDSGVDVYTVWVRANGGDWAVWLEETTDTQAEFSGEPGTRYEFAVWARDLGGNWSTNTDLSPQAETMVQ